MNDWREENIARWDSAAPGWKATRPIFQHVVLPVSHWMVEAIHPQPGHRVLELAAGLGDTGLLAAELVLPGGSVIITDAADGMVNAAGEHAKEVGASNVEVRAMQAEWIDLPAASVDGVLCRFGYMLLADPEAALRETRRVLKSGGRVALAVWDLPERNPWASVFRAAADSVGISSPPAPNQSGQFALSAPGALEEVLQTAGFEDVEVEGIDLEFEAESLDAWWDFVMQTSPTATEQVRGLPPAEHYKLRDAVDAGYAEYVRDDGSLLLPARALVAAATA
jgi:ubiquinone/menaquinone biosynthesis C-methylase UbiE